MYLNIENLDSEDDKKVESLPSVYCLNFENYNALQLITITITHYHYPISDFDPCISRISNC